MFPAPKSNWRPSATLEQLRVRAQLLQQLRAFFAARQVLEVSTPVLASAGVSDPFIDNYVVEHHYAHSAKLQRLYLQSSPEYAMKRLLAAGCEHIYQIGPVFRHEDSGRQHNPEFCLLEWYRSGFSMQDLIDEVIALLKTVLALNKVTQVSYQQVFLQYLHIDPLIATHTELFTLAKQLGIDLVGDKDSVDKDDLLQLIFSTAIEPEFANQQPVVVSHFPASQAALACLNKGDKRLANRFEVYYKGVELANGFEELSDGKEQRLRFEQDNHKRVKLGKSPMPIDEKFLAALKHGLPQCSGVALGVDRLHMIFSDAEHISQVMAFDVSQC